MGRNRKFVLEDDLQQAVWRTILRGPRFLARDAQLRVSCLEAQPAEARAAEEDPTEGAKQTSTTPEGSGVCRRGLCSGTPERAKEALADAIASQEKEEGLLIEGERRLEALLAEERTIPSPFVAPPAIPVSSTVCNRRFAQLRGVPIRSTVMDDDDDVEADLPHKKSRVAPRTPLAITGGHAADTFPAITGSHVHGLSLSR